jgi:succinoglycan biosynthesis protein ExoV
MAGRLGFRLISPRLDVLPFLDALAECEFVVTEAMHGAIIADALRIPWYPIRANSLAREGATSSFKWSDWCGSVGLEFSPLDLPPFWPRQKGYLNRVRATVKMAGVERSLKKLARGRVRYLSSDRVLESRLAQLNDIILGFDESVLGGMDSLGGRRGDTG